MPALVGYSLDVDRHDFSDLSAALDEAEALGVDSVELPIYAMDLVAGGRILEDRLARFQAAVAGRPFRYSAHGVLGINLMVAPERLARHEAVVRANIEIAGRLSARHLVIHTGSVPAARAGDLETAYARQRESLSQLGDVAAAAGVVLCVENIFSFTGDLTATPGRLAAELAAIGHPAVVATFDVSHGALQCTVEGKDFLAEAADLLPWSRHLHVHDSFGIPLDFWTYHQSETLAFGAGDLHLPLGWGDLPWDVLAACGRIPADAVFNIELEPRYWPELAETVRRTRLLAAAAGA